MKIKASHSFKYEREICQNENKTTSAFSIFFLKGNSNVPVEVRGSDNYLINPSYTKNATEIL